MATTFPSPVHRGPEYGNDTQRRCSLSICYDYAMRRSWQACQIACSQGSTWERSSDGHAAQDKILCTLMVPAEMTTSIMKGQTRSDGARDEDTMLLGYVQTFLDLGLLYLDTVCPVLSGSPLGRLDATTCDIHSTECVGRCSSSRATSRFHMSAISNTSTITSLLVENPSKPASIHA
jgi:hypothetical protein